MRSLITGLVLGVLGIAISYFLKSPELTETGLLVLGLGAMLLAAVFSGALVSGDRVSII